MNILRGLSFSVAAAFAAAVASAQLPVSALLPEATVLALHASSDGFDPARLASLLDGLDLDRAAAAVAKLGALLDEAAETQDEVVAPWEDLAQGCPGLGQALEGLADDWGDAALAAALPRFDPTPAVVGVLRPVQSGLADDLVAGAVACFGGTDIGSEGSARLYVLADGSDLPVVVAASGGVVVAATDPAPVREVLRRVAGSGEPGFTATRVGAVTAGTTSRGLAVTLNLDAAADAFELVRPLLGEPPEASALLDRTVTTLRVLGGFAWRLAVDEAGVSVGSVTAVDARLAREAGEEELLALLTCEGCELGAPRLLPQDAVAVRAAVASPRALVAWLDTWLRDAAEAGFLEARGVRELASSLVGLDLDEALLGWVGDSWQSAVLDVLATDAGPWLRGLPTVTTVPVSSMEAARRGVRLWFDALGRLSDVTGSLAPLVDAPGAPRLEEAVSVREGSYRGVDYLRVRAGLAFDLGVAVFGGHLVLAWPESSLHKAVDVFLGGEQTPGTVWRTYESLDPGGEGLAAYALLDAPAFLRGLARVSDLAAGFVATAGWLGAQGVADDDVPGELLTYDDVIALADVVTDALTLLAERTGVAIGTAEVRDGVVWRTWWLPLR